MPFLELVCRELFCGCARWKGILRKSILDKAEFCYIGFSGGKLLKFGKIDPYGGKCFGGKCNPIDLSQSIL